MSGDGKNGTDEKYGKKSFLNWVDGPVLGYGPPKPPPELVMDRVAIHEELKRDRKRRTVRVRSILP